MDVSIILVNYNGASVICPCLDTILNSKVAYDYEIIVIDNASEDNSLIVLKPYERHIHMIKNHENVGFSKANNQGLAIAKGQCVFLLNNDTLLFEDTLQQLMMYYNDHSEVGAIGPKLLNHDQSIQRQGGLLGRWRYGNKVKQVNFLVGAALLCERDYLKNIGGFDENFFFYNEDIDLCWRIKKTGRKLIYYPVAKLIHLGGASTQTRKAPSIIEGYRGGLYLCYKHYPRYVFHTYRIVLLFDVVPKICWYGLRSFLNPEMGTILEAYIDIFKINISQSIFYKKHLT